MPGIAESSLSLAEFKNHAEEAVPQIKGTHQPLELTVAGRVEYVVLDAGEYQRLKDLAAHASEAEGIRQGEEDIRMGRTRPAREVLEEIRLRLGISR